MFQNIDFKNNTLKCSFHDGFYPFSATVKAFYFVGQKFRRLKMTDIFVGT